MDENTALQDAIAFFKEALQGFSYEDFVESDIPYTLLAESAVDRESRTRFELLLRKRAKECGVPVKTVDSILKAKAAKQGQPTQAAEVLTSWEGQPLALRMGRYEVDGDRILLEDKFGLESVCSHPIMPTKRYINIETQTESLEISFKREYWKSVVVSRGALANVSTIVQLADHGVSITSETAKAMVKYITYIDDINRDLIPVEKMSSHLGWISENDFVPYVDGVEYDGQGQFQQMYKTIKTSGSRSAWMDAVKAIRAAGCLQARIVMAASFASVMLSHFDALPFFVHLWSSQAGTGKTVTMELAASVWADPQVGAYCRPIKSTSVGLEQLAIFTCNLPLCLDELQTIQDKRDFDDVIYSLCEGSGKTRGAKSGGLRKSPTWKNCIITTGEMPIISSRSKAGAMNRVIEIECKGKLMDDAKGVHRIISANYGFAGRDFIAALADKKTKKQVDQWQQEFFDQLAVIGTDKQALSASILLTADKLAEKVLFKDGITISVEDLLAYVRTNEDVSTGRKSHDYLMEWIAENRSSFIIDGKEPESRTVYGCIDTDPETKDAKTVWIIGKIFSEAMQAGGFSPDSYLSWAQGEGLIRLQGGSRKVVKRMPGSGVQIRCVCLTLDNQKIMPGGLTQIRYDESLPF